MSDPTQPGSADPASEQPPKDGRLGNASPIWTFLLGLYYILLPAGLLYLFAAVWTGTGHVAVNGDASSRPAVTTEQAAVPSESEHSLKELSCDEDAAQRCAFVVLGAKLDVKKHIWLGFLVTLAGALGGYIAAAMSFATFVGNRKFVRSWTWWYVLRTPVAMVLSLIFYFVFRAGLLGSDSSANTFGFIAIGGLVGMFSKQATDKLEEVFKTLFKSNTDELRMDSLDNKG